MSTCGIVIPAHMGSTRFPGKPLAIVGGRPLLSYAVDAARVSGLSWCVATNDGAIDMYFRDLYGDRFNAQHVVFTAQCRNGTERAALANKTKAWDRVIVLQCDEPDVTRLDLLELSRKPTPCTIACLPDIKDVDNPHSVAVGITVAWVSSVALFFRRGVTLGNTMRHVGVYSYDANMLASYLEHPPTQAEESQSLEQLRTMAMGYAWHLMGLHDRVLRSVNVPEDVNQFKEDGNTVSRPA